MLAILHPVRGTSLVPAEGYYEWRTENGAKQPYLIKRADDQPMAFAGLWERWTPKDPPGNPVETFTIVTTAASESAGRVHDRMPLILDLAVFDAWLNGSPDDAAGLLRPYVGALRIAPVNKAMSSVRNQGGEAAAEIGPPLA